MKEAFVLFFFVALWENVQNINVITVSEQSCFLLLFK